MTNKLVELIAKYFEKLNPNSNHIIATQLAGYLRNNGVTFATADNDCGCTTCGNHGKADICSECAFDSKWEAKPMTNGDRIRAMSDEELADFLGWRSLCGHIQIDHYEVCETRGVCGGCVLNWLKQPTVVDHDTD